MARRKINPLIETDSRRREGRMTYMSTSEHSKVIPCWTSLRRIRRWQERWRGREPMVVKTKALID